MIATVEGESEVASLIDTCALHKLVFRGRRTGMKDQSCRVC